MLCQTGVLFLGHLVHDLVLSKRRAKPQKSKKNLPFLSRLETKFTYCSLSTNITEVTLLISLAVRIKNNDSTTQRKEGWL